MRDCLTPPKGASAVEMIPHWRRQYQLDASKNLAPFWFHCDGWIGDDSMRRQAGFFDVDDRPVFGVRLSADERKALDMAAAAEDRPAAYVARRAILDWLKEKGFMKWPWWTRAARPVRFAPLPPLCVG
jgi:hypothetical protein